MPGNESSCSSVTVLSSSAHYGPELVVRPGNSIFNVFRFASRVYFADYWLAGVTALIVASTLPPTAYIYMAFLAESRQVREIKLRATFRKGRDVMNLQAFGRTATLAPFAVALPRCRSRVLPRHGGAGAVRPPRSLGALVLAQTVTTTATVIA